MHRDRANWLLLGGLLILAVVLVFAADKLTSLDAKIAALFSRKEPMQTITQEVVRANGSKVTISTVRLENEAVAVWLARHDTAVQAAKNS